MSQLEKLRGRLKGIPVDFRWDELVVVLRGFGFEEESGKGSSHRRFRNPKTSEVIMLPRPHGTDLHVRRHYLREIVKKLHLEEGQ